MPNAAHRGSITEAFSSSGSDSSESSSSSLTSSRKNSATTATTVVQQRRNSEGPRTLQSLVRTKCWSIAPLWKFVTYELETAPIKPQLPPSSKSQQSEKLSRSASFRPKKQHQKQNHKTISYENDLNQMFKMVSSGPSGIPQRKTPVWSKPHPQQSLNKRQPLQPANNRILVEPIVHLKQESEPIMEHQAPLAMPTIDPEYKPCGVLKKPGSYRSHHGLKKVAFLENTELNRSTL